MGALAKRRGQGPGWRTYGHARGHWTPEEGEVEMESIEQWKRTRPLREILDSIRRHLIRRNLLSNGRTYKKLI